MLFDAVVVGENLWASYHEKNTEKYLGGVIQMTVWDCQFKIERITPKANDSFISHFNIDHFSYKTLAM
jgi:hypothetical protein